MILTHTLQPSLERKNYARFPIKVFAITEKWYASPRIGVGGIYAAADDEAKAITFFNVSVAGAEDVIGTITFDEAETLDLATTVSDMVKKFYDDFIQDIIRKTHERELAEKNEGITHHD